MKAILFDLDGVFYQGNHVIRDAPEVSRWLNEQAIPHLFVTNTSSKPRAEILSKLNRFGIETDLEHLFTPAVASLKWLKERSLTHRVALYVPELTQSEFRAIDSWKNDKEPPEAIIVGDLGFAWNYKLMNQIFRQLMARPDTPFIALGMTRYWQAEEGLRLDIAPFIKALEYASGVKAQVMGKPANAFFNAALKILGAAAKDTVMIGDDIQSDIAGAQQAGIAAWLVKTGKFRESDLACGITPDKVLNSVAELQQCWH